MITQAKLASTFRMSPDELNTYAHFGLLFPIMTDGGVVYDEHAVLRLQIIAQGKEKGFSIEEIKLLIDRAGFD